jgi:LCP family protein required for cell wall assembly
MDHRDKDPDPSWRTDSLMVLAIDRAASRVGVVSIPRDLYLDIPGLGPARINQVDYYGEESRYPGGGPALLRRVLKENFDIPVQNYVRVQMDGLVSLVDALEGVTVTLKCPLYERTPDAYSANGVRDWSLPAGEVFLNGQDAKKFATYRYVTTDFGRAQRQQQLIWAIRNRALQLNVIPRIPALWNALRETFTSDLGLLDIINLATLGAGLKPDNVRGMVWNTDVLDYAWTDEGASVLVVKDKKKMLEELSHLFDARPLASLSSNGTGANGACPPRPTAIPAFTPTPVVTATVSITATVPLTGTVLPPPTETPKGP